jgi:hypothetical protein
MYGQPPPKSNAGLAAAIFGGLAAVGGIAAAAYVSRPKPAAGPKLSGARFTKKKPCGCGR